LVDRVAVCRRHLDDSVKWKGERVAIFETRKHYGSYFKGIFGFKPYRMRLVTANSITELNDIFDEIESSLGV
jgi:tRNA-dihydrouridine synthase